MTLHLRGFDPEGQVGPTGQLDNAGLVQALGAAYPTEYGLMFQDLRWINDPDAQTMIPSGAKSTPSQSLDPALAQQIMSLPSFSEVSGRLQFPDDHLDSADGGTQRPRENGQLRVGHLG